MMDLQLDRLTPALCTIACGLKTRACHATMRLPLLTATDEVIKALADTSRRSLLDRLHARNGQTLNELCDGLHDAAGADIGGVQPEIFFRFCGGGRAEDRRSFVARPPDGSVHIGGDVIERVSPKKLAVTCNSNWPALVETLCPPRVFQYEAIWETCCLVPSQPAFLIKLYGLIACRCRTLGDRDKIFRFEHETADR